MKTIFITILCVLMIGCKSKDKGVPKLGYMSADCVCSDTLGSEVRMKMIHGNYTIKTDEVFTIVLNSQRLLLSYGSYWTLEKWENNCWTTPELKDKYGFLSDSIQDIIPQIYYCFRFPIKYYKITPGRYRISKSLWNDSKEIKLSAEFEIK